jgi:hypothetical protein
MPILKKTKVASQSLFHYHNAFTPAHIHPQHAALRAACSGPVFGLPGTLPQRALEEILHTAQDFDFKSFASCKWWGTSTFSSLKGIPGPRPLPVVGNLPQMLGTSHNEAQADLMRQYGGSTYSVLSRPYCGACLTIVV